MDFIVILILVVILGSAITYIIKAKKAGVKCVGCPMSKTCSSNHTGSSCKSHTTQTNKNVYDELSEFDKTEFKK